MSVVLETLVPLPDDWASGGKGLAANDSQGAPNIKDVIEALVAGSVQQRTVTITSDDLTEAGNGVAEAVNIGAVLPAKAQVVGRVLRDITQFTGGGAVSVDLDVGGTDIDAIVDGEDVLGGGTVDRKGTDGVNPNGRFDAEQLVATFTPDGANSLLDLTAGAVTIDIMFTQPTT